MSDKVLKYRIPNVTRQTGEVARLRVLKGSEVGSTFVLKASSITIGRGEEVDLIISDLKSSRSHARLDYTKEGWVMSDLGSANGIYFQGEYIRKFGLNSTDHFTIGETIFEFLNNQESTRMLSAPLKDPGEIERQEQALSQQKIKVQNLSKPVKATPKGNAKKNSPLTLVLIAALAGAYFFMDGDKPAAQPAAKKEKSDTAAKTEEDRALASYLPSSAVSKDVEKTAEQYYWQGFREYMKGNYLRAKDSFELALQVNPSHAKARHYLASAEKENHDEIKRLIEAAKKARLVGRTSDAKGKCETALRHLYNDRANPDYADCDEILKEIKAGGDQ